MVKQTISAILSIFLLASCSSIKPLNFTSSRQLASPDVTATTKNSSAKFIQEISVTPQSAGTAVEVKPEIKETSKETVATRSLSAADVTVNENQQNINDYIARRSSTIEEASSLQLKYSILLNTEVEQLQNTALLQGMDEWYGTPYRMGGTTKSGIDCSAFVGAIFSAVYGITLPRVAREQYRVTRRISRTELQEGDLLFFNTRGGVSHVGIYLQNNKFIHASVSKGVTISDMFEPYYLQRFIGAGRVDDKDTLVKY